jgi:hypothetical protein
MALAALPMSASEKLKALSQALDDWGQEALVDALPQIVAVVEAAEQVLDLETSFGDDVIQVDATLRALDGALP